MKRSTCPKASSSDTCRGGCLQKAEASGVGVFDDDLIAGILEHSREDALKIFWDVDAAATLDEMRRSSDHPVRRELDRLDLVLTYGGGPPVVEADEAFGAARCVPVYNALDPETHHPVEPDPRFAADLSFLGNRLPDREARVDEFFLQPAAALPASVRCRFDLSQRVWTGGRLVLGSAASAAAALSASGLTPSIWRSGCSIFRRAATESCARLKHLALDQN